MKIAVFYPTSIRNFNPFDAAERKVFEYLAQNYDWNITLFVDKTNNYDYTGNALRTREISPLPSLIQLPFRVLHKVVGYVPVPMYPALLIKSVLREYDLVLTENPWYALTLYPYFQAKKFILVDSTILDQRINRTTFSIIKKAVGIVCITSLVAEKYRRLRLLSDLEIEKLKVVGGHPIDINLFKPGKNYPGNEFVNIVSTGRLVYEKGFHIIIEALKEIVKKHRNIRLHVIGDGSYKASLGRKARAYGLLGYIKFYGALKSEQIAEIYKSAHIFVNHSLDTSYWREYFGVVNLEAMSAGLPVITSDCGAIPWVVRDNAIIVEQRNIKSLIATIKSLILDKNRRIQLGEQGRKFVSNNYTVETIANSYYRAITEIMSQTGVEH